jgi:hypothetical protein
MAERTIEIPEIKLDRMTVSVVGTSPLLTNRFGENAIASIESKQQKKAKGAKEARDPQAEFLEKLHVITPGKGPLDGIFGYPSIGIKKCLVVAGGRFADEKMTHLRGAINVMGTLIEIKAPPPTMRTDTVRLQGGITSIAYRPSFWPWEMEIQVVYNAGIIGPSQILNLFQIAGFAVGFGAWRPELNGVFGQFVLKDSATVSTKGKIKARQST